MPWTLTVIYLLKWILKSWKIDSCFICQGNIFNYVAIMWAMSTDKKSSQYKYEVLVN